MERPVNIFNGRLVFGFDWTKPHDWRDNASNLEEWESWDRAKRKERGWFAGLDFWKRTNVPSRYTLLSRHWPHRLCWDWSISVGLVRPLYDGSRKVSFILSRKHRILDICLIFFNVHAAWQNYQYMGGMGIDGQSVPKIYWSRHLKNADPAGNA